MKKSDDHIFYQSIADEATVGIIALQVSNFSCTYTNKLAREVLELGAHFESKDLKIETLFTEDDKGGFRSFNKEILESDRICNDVLCQKQNGMRFIANIATKTVVIGTEKLLLVMFEDVTYEKKLQREVKSKQEELEKAFSELLEQNRQLKELDQAKDKFMALTTHELRTPVSAMVATAEVLEMKLYDTEEQLQEFISTIHEQGKHLLELVNDVLDLAKIQAGKMDYYIEQLPILEVVEHQLENFTQMATENKINLKIEKNTEDTLCYFDKLRLSQVVNNLLSNAIKFNHENGTVTFKISRSEEFTSLEISDTGQGIAPEHIDSIFNEFETLGSISRHQQGTGLGMPITKRIMESIGGKISVTSTLGKGTTFTIAVPNGKVLDDEFYRSRPEWTDDLVA